jgi:transposase-like protein
VRQAEGDGRKGAAPATDDRQRLLERENRVLRRTNESLREASAFFAAAELDRRPSR